jgi:hypothetical protein
MKRLTRSRLKSGEVIYENNGFFYMGPPGNEYILITPLKTSELLSYIPDCEETDDREKNCSVFVMQKWFVKNTKTNVIQVKLISAYLARWNTAWVKYNHIVSIKEIEEPENPI